MMKMQLAKFATASLLTGLAIGTSHAAPQREVKIDSILLETVDLVRELGGSTQILRMLKVCLDGQAYFLLSGKPPSAAVNSFAPAFKDGKPEICKN